MDQIIRILLATSNPHKVDEVRAILEPAGLAVHCLADLPAPIAEPAEDQPTFHGNALLKARYYARHTGQLCLADDSGLEVDALCGRPGVLSARYAGITGPRSIVDPANNAKLLDELAGTPDADRSARFVCAMALADPTRTLAQVRGMVEGRILHRPRGANGFGYDPLFLIPALDQSTAELSPEHKNRISHRGHATRMILDALRRLRLL